MPVSGTVSAVAVAYGMILLVSGSTSSSDAGSAHCSLGW